MGLFKMMLYNNRSGDFFENMCDGDLNFQRKDLKMKHDLKPVVLADMVEYQNDAIVSKTIVEKNTGTVTLFAFDQGQGLSEHTAPFDAMVQVLDGEVEIRISGNPYHLNQGEMIVMPANEPHALKAVRRFKMLLTLVRS
jgi:quercetin dioxygenase-like cupin family protein